MTKKNLFQRLEGLTSPLNLNHIKDHVTVRQSRLKHLGIKGLRMKKISFKAQKGAQIFY